MLSLHTGRLRLSYPRQSSNMLKMAVGGRGRHAATPPKVTGGLLCLKERLEDVHPGWDVPHREESAARKTASGSWGCGSVVQYLSHKCEKQLGSLEPSEKGTWYRVSQIPAILPGDKMQTRDSSEASQPGSLKHALAQNKRSSFQQGGR